MRNLLHHAIVIIGGGPAGLAAAVCAKKNGVDDILIIERDTKLGGILNQCIHNGLDFTHLKKNLPVRNMHSDLLIRQKNFLLITG